MDIPKGVYWNVIILHIEYILNVSIKRKGDYWPKMYLLIKNVPIEWKVAYWSKKMSIEWKSVYWLKMCILNENVLIERL